jgi:N-[(2S)-2-amino-2-carboxyethyl]-L-glutamate dehydrogenase
MGKRTEFLYLSEADIIESGVLDMAHCVDVAEEVFALLGKGDYLMGGSNHNSHGMGLVFPKESPFPNMPVAGPDRRFVAMPAYLGGRFDVCGNKWYGSNAANTSKGLPRSVLTFILNDKDTGEPLCFMSANLISATRTGAIPGVVVRHIARKDSEVCTVFGCGPINKACYRAIVTQAPNLKTVVCYDIFKEKAQSFADWSKTEFGIEGITATSAEGSLKAGDIITIAASRLEPVFFEDNWVKKGATVIFTGPAKAEDAFWLNSKIIYDNTKLHEAYMEEAVSSGDKQKYYDGVIGGPLYKLIDEGKLPCLSKSISFGDIILGEKIGRKNYDERIAFIASGMAVFDVGWGYELYQTALKKGIGQKLLLWDEPYWS